MPFYQFRCGIHGDIDIDRPMERAHLPAHCAVCDTQMERVFAMPNISVTVMTSRHQETADHVAREKSLSADRDAYKRMRHDGVQPRAVQGSAHLEKHASTEHELAMGKIMPTKDVKQGVAMSEEMVGKDLEL